MRKKIFEIYKSIEDLMDEEMFKKEIEQRYEDFEGLLNEEAIAMMIVDELGRTRKRFVKISELPRSRDASLKVVVKGVNDIREFKRKNGKRGRVLNINIADDSGECRLTLWDDEVKLVEEGDIRIGNILRIINGNVKVTNFGVEVGIGRWGQIEVEG